MQAFLNILNTNKGDYKYSLNDIIYLFKYYMYLNYPNLMLLYNYIKDIFKKKR